MPDEAITLRRRLYSYVPWVEMAQIIVDVDRWTGFLRSFTHLLTGASPTGYHKAVLTRCQRFADLPLAALMESGMNIGPTKMAQASDFSERELMHLTEWHIREETSRQAWCLARAIARATMLASEAFRAAQAELDNFVLHHPFSKHWGSGTTSSSDGMRVPVVVNAANAYYNARYFWYRRGVTIMTHAADIWMPFYPQVISDTRCAVLSTP